MKMWVMWSWIVQSQMRFNETKDTVVKIYSIKSKSTVKLTLEKALSIEIHR